MGLILGRIRRRRLGICGGWLVLLGEGSRCAGLAFDTWDDLDVILLFFSFDCAFPYLAQYCTFPLYISIAHFHCAFPKYWLN